MQVLSQSQNTGPALNPRENISGIIGSLPKQSRCFVDLEQVSDTVPLSILSVVLQVYGVSDPLLQKSFPVGVGH